MENYYNHKFAVFPAAVPVGFQSLGLVAKPENQNGPRTELGTPSVGLQRWINLMLNRDFIDSNQLKPGLLCCCRKAWLLSDDLTFTAMASCQGQG